MSRFVIIEIWCGSLRNVPSLSSASTTIHLPFPNLLFFNKEFIMPPLMIVGSSLPDSKIFPTKLVVVVFPCDPAIAIDFLFFISSASISARLTIGICFLFASIISGLFWFIAEEKTTAFTSFKLFLLCPIFTLIPISLNLFTFSLSLLSLPKIV